MKVIVLGANGMAGHVIFKYLCEQDPFILFGVSRDVGPFVTDVLDVSNQVDLQRLLQDINPDVVINCIGVLVQESIERIDNAIFINSYLPHYLVYLSDLFNFKLIHLSTDCVFSGKTGHYLEESIPDSVDNYGRTKALGEICDNKNLSIRTSIIGPELKANGNGLLDWYLKSNSRVAGYSNVFWSGVTTLELARFVRELLVKDIHGLYHLTNNNRISKYELLLMLSRVINKNIEIIPIENPVHDRSFINTRRDLKYTVNSYKDMIDDVCIWINNNRKLYQHYNLQ